MPHRLTDRVCVIAGASGMAAATARLVAAEGGDVFVISLDGNEAEALAQQVSEAGGRAGWAGADLRDEEATAAAFDTCVDRFGRVDCLFAAAGASARRHGDGAVHEASLSGFRAAIDLNVVPAFTAAQCALRAMLPTAADPDGRRGSILLMSSVLATSPANLFATHGYAAAKGAVESLTVAMAARYAADGIRVNAIAPGLIDTPMSARAQTDPTTATYIASKQPLAAGPLPAESAADLAAFLLSDASRHLTGQVIAIDGGWSMTEASPD